MWPLWLVLGVLLIRVCVVLQRTRRRCELKEEVEVRWLEVWLVGAWKRKWKWMSFVVVEKVEAFALLIRKARESHVRFLP